MNNRHPAPWLLRLVADAFRTLDNRGSGTIIDFGQLGITTVVGHASSSPAADPHSAAPSRATPGRTCTTSSEPIPNASRPPG